VAQSRFGACLADAMKAFNDLRDGHGAFLFTLRHSARDSRSVREDMSRTPPLTFSQGGTSALSCNPRMITHLHSVAIFVADRDRALAFYKSALGFEVTADIKDPTNSNNRWLTIKPPSSQTSLMLLKRSEEMAEHHSTQLTLATSDIDADCRRIQSHGGTILHQPKRAGWGNAIETHFADPDGNVFLLIQLIQAP